MECPPDRIVNFKTLNCVRDTPANRMRLGYPLKPCPPAKPLRNPATLRCLQDTPYNRKKLGLPLLRADRPKPRAKRPPPEPKPTAKKPPPEPKPTAKNPPPEPKPTAKKPPPEPKSTAKNPPPEPKPTAKKPPPEPKPTAKKPPPEPKPTAKTRPPEPKLRANKSPPEPESESGSETIPAYFPRSQVEIDNDLPPVRRVLMDVEPYRKPIPMAKAKKTPLASHLHKLAYGDYLDEQQIDFLDKMSLVNERRARWKGQRWQSAVGLLYIAMRHRETACVALTDPKFLSFDGFQWEVYEIGWSEPKYAVETMPVLYRKVVAFRRFGVKKRRVLQLTSDYMDIELAFRRCRKHNKRFMIGLIELSNHMNAFVYDIHLQTLEVFEPHGSGSLSLGHEFPQELYKAVYTVMRKYVPVKKLIRPQDYCPIGPQTLDSNVSSMFNAMMIRNKPLGYCAAWSLYYLDLRLSNPDIPHKTLIDAFNDRFWYNSLTFINGYSNFIVKMYDDLIASPGFRDASSSKRKDAIRERMMQVMRNVYGN